RPPSAPGRPTGPPPTPGGAGRPLSGTSHRPPAGSARRRRWPEPGMVVAGAALAVGVGGVAAALALTGGAGQHAAPTPPGTTVGAPDTPGGACPPAPAPAADVDGDGCPEGLRVDRRTVTAG